MHTQRRWPTAAELDDLAARFEARTIPLAEWTHSAHLAVGTWYVCKYGRDAALSMLRTGIRELNVAQGGVNSDSDGYHETITRAYVWLIAAFAEAARDAITPDHAARAVLESVIARKGALLEYYSEPALMSVRARREWVEPDIKPLID